MSASVTFADVRCDRCGTLFATWRGETLVIERGQNAYTITPDGIVAADHKGHTKAIPLPTRA